jgi:hypothetical protein
METSLVPVLNARIRKYYQGKPDQWELMEDCVVLVDGWQHIIPKGFITDFASTPWWCPNWLVPRSGRSAMPSLAHDFLYTKSGVSRHVADQTFRELLRQAGVPFWQRNLMVNYVAMLGWLRFSK